MKALINGLGLIGGSLAYAISKFQPEVQITGLDANAQNLIQAQQMGIIDTIGTNLATEAPQADIIILATPVQIIRQTMRALSQLTLKPQVIITDTGSTKQEVLNQAIVLTEQGYTLIGGHPMAGSHKSGVRAANWDLFRSAFYLLVPAPGTKPAQIEKLKQLLAVANVRFLVLNAKQHDHLVALLSHVPHILAANLVQLASRDLNQSPEMLRLAAGGFRDMTRIASSDPDMWVDILDTNTTEILKLLYTYEKQLHGIEKMIATQDRSAIRAFFQGAKITREKIEANKKAGALPGFYDLHVDIPDKTGSIAQVTTILAENKINILNIQILETRDTENGVLQLTFANQTDLDKAKTLLTEKVSVK